MSILAKTLLQTDEADKLRIGQRQRAEGDPPNQRAEGDPPNIYLWDEQ